jgi:6-pyruvoyltetrahydropterin/6-carboxytetrahydropterin synthase
MLQQMYPQVPHNFRYELNKDFQFAAAHFVPHPDAGVCQRIHGHTYFVNITIGGNHLDHTGFLINFKTLKDLIHKRFDHTVLNDDEAFNDLHPIFFATTEVVAQTIAEIVQKHIDTYFTPFADRPYVLQVFLRETPTSYVVYRPEATTWK